ncbi:MAG: hypothetical protein JNG85_13090 [Spirochaetaceae bacterium]|nr:hypothetical protein [Spirochaetaceae bacterium]
MSTVQSARRRSFHAATLAPILVLALGSLRSTFAEGAAPWGAKAAAADPGASVPAMLRYAIEDEYLARAEYVAIMGRFGADRPFSNIKASEDSHIAWLAAEFASRGLALPADEGAAHVVLPAGLKEAFAAGVRAELDNIAMYEAFLRNPALSGAADAALRELFSRLKAASENHLAAFRNGLSKY